jgi:hypothetical protein
VRSRVAALVAAIVAAAAVSSAQGGVPVCHAGQLRGRVLGSTGAAGTIVLSVTLTNRGSSCTMTGYTGLRLVSGTHSLPTRVLHGGPAVLTSRPLPVRLGDGGRATVLIAYSDVPTGTERRCPTSTAVLVRPPGDLHWLRVNARVQACNHGTLRESPVLAGRRPAP